MRTIVFFDGHNFSALRKTHGDLRAPYDHPSYDVELLAQRLVSLTSGRTLQEIWFYTGVYRRDQDWERHWFWTNKLDHLETQGIHVYRGRVRGGLNETKQGKGVDVSLAIDLIQATHEQRYDAAVILSKDSDFGPAVLLSKQIAARPGSRYQRFLYSVATATATSAPIGGKTALRQLCAAPSVCSNLSVLWWTFPITTSGSLGGNRITPAGLWSSDSVGGHRYSGTGRRPTGKGATSPWARGSPRAPAGRSDAWGTAAELYTLAARRNPRLP